MQDEVVEPSLKDGESSAAVAVMDTATRPDPHAKTAPAAARPDLPASEPTALNDAHALATTAAKPTAFHDAHTLPSTAAEPSLAPQRLGRYLVPERLGQGGMGVVLAAYDPQLDRRIAIKLLRGGRTSRRAASQSC